MPVSEERHSEAKILYVRSKVRNLSRLSAITGISRRTLGKWRTEEKWDDEAQTMDVEPGKILETYVRMINRIQVEIDDMEEQGIPPSDSTLKRLALYHKLAAAIDDKFDIGGTIIKFGDSYIDFVSGQPDFPGKKDFIKQLEKYLPAFIEYVVHSAKI
jgi:hypothetical protein